MKQNKLLMNYEWYSTPVQYTTVQHSSLVQGGNKYINEQNKLLLEALFYYYYYYYYYLLLFYCTVQLV